MQIDQAGINFITNWEGFRSMPYQDVAGKWTCGYGHLMRPGDSYPNGITEAQALVLLAMDVAPVSAAGLIGWRPSAIKNAVAQCTLFIFVTQIWLRWGVGADA